MPSITRKPSIAQYGNRSRKMHRNIVFNLLISLACTIIVAQTAPSVAATDSRGEADKVCAQLHAADAYCEVLRD